ncbi:MAG: 6,7-dimethyl-8-ribityllumazine synthase [Gammaproteobacteria bacterium RIFCSPHIGHO2_12_FULL_45_9]|nr:MAG: 6,7-dimethyl-8-ribityllumazine synthase [Gammaproteobacteria bacterium RIFCSPHIGHO2_12_FULL_45_9]
MVVSRFNVFVTERLREGAATYWREVGLPAENVLTAWVPGAVELPLVAQELARTAQYQAIVCLGAVIRGETDHYEYVCRQVSDGCQRVALAERLPVIFGVLTTETEEQALARAGGNAGHKGRESAQAALEMIDLLQSIRGTGSH